MRTLKTSSWWGKAIQLLGGALAILLLSLPAFSQGGAGRILGTVTDQTGGVVAGATVTVIDTERGVTRTLNSDDAGEYNAPNLTPSTYTVRAEAKGFKKLERQNVVIEVGKEVRVDLTVQPGAQEQTVTVTESIPLVETTNATLGGTLNNADIQDMPLNGRNYQNLLSLRPGVMVQAGGGPWTQSTNNVRPDESVWMVDGIINANFNDARSIAGMSSPFTDGATILPVDAIQEFNLEENPKAEYGWKPGAVVNVGVRSGTNTLHGSAYGFYRSAAWDARSLFNPVDSPTAECHSLAPEFCAQSPVQLKQFGGVVGGPIKKDKLFFFAGYEGLRSFVGQKLGTAGVPETVSQANAANPGGDPAHSMVDALWAAHLAGPVSPVSMALTGCTLGASLATTICGQHLTTGGVYNLFPSNTSSSTTYLSPLPNTNISDNGIAKIDYHINNKNSINGLVIISDYTGDGVDHPIVGAGEEDTFLAHTRTVSADWVSTASSRLVNEFRFGYDRFTAPFSSDDGNILADGSGLTGGKGFPINTGITSVGGLPNLYIGSFAVLGTWHNRPQSVGNWYTDFQDSVSYLVGKHTLKFGGEFTYINVDNLYHDNVRGRVDFSSLQTFYEGTPKTKGGGRIFTGDAQRTMLWNSFSGFVQDDWRVTPRLTLNMGLRYTYTQPMREVNNLWGNFDPNSTTGLVQQGQQGVGPTLYRPDPKDFSPRLGFAWDVNGKGTTVVRGGFSIIYSTLIVSLFQQQTNLQNTTGTTVASDPTGACRVVVAPGLTCPAGETYGGNITAVSQKINNANLCWDSSNPAFCGASASGQKTVFPQGTVAQCTGATPCNLLAVDPNLTTPYVTNWSLGIQHQFTNNLSLEVGYVGTHGARLTGVVDLNQPQGDPKNFGYVAGTQPFATQFPGFNYINYISNNVRSNYNSLQATLTKRTSHGLSFTAGYTYGHGLDNGSLNRAFQPQDSTNAAAEYGSSDFDIRHRLTVTASYDIPGIKGFAQLLEGWKLNSILTLQTSQPWLVSESSPNAQNFSNSGETADRWNLTGPASAWTSGANSFPFCSGPPVLGVSQCSQTSGVSGLTTATPDVWSKCTAADAAFGATAGVGSVSDLAAGGCFVSGNSVITPPWSGHFGNMGRNIFSDSGFKNLDFSVFKNFTFKERYSAQFRAEIFNVLNHPNIANPYGSVNGWGVGNDPSLPRTFGCGCATSDIAAGNPQVGSGGARALQIGLKLMF